MKATSHTPLRNFRFTVAAVLCLAVTISGHARTTASVTDTGTTVLDSISITSLFLELYSQGSKVGNASGFVVSYRDSFFLVTNWHVVTGIDPYNNGRIISPPDTIGVHMFLGGLPLKWARKMVPLFSPTGLPYWSEHPNGKHVDLVAVPLPQELVRPTGIAVLHMPIDESDIDVNVGTPATIVGFPEGMSGGGKLPIWKTGYVASEPDIDFMELPAMLIDIRTSKGMSGSPAFVISHNGYMSRKHGGYVIAPPARQFIGVYSAAFSAKTKKSDSSMDIGMIWKISALEQVLQRAFGHTR